MTITNIQKLSELTSTALVTYAYFDIVKYTSAGLMLTDKQKGADMTQAQAEAFVSRYSLLDQHTNDPTGFAGTLFYDKIERKKVLALRGTEFTQGLGQIATDGVLADVLGIGGAGFANVQAVQLFRYVKQLSTAGGKAVEYSDEDVVKLFMLFYAPALETAALVLPTLPIPELATWIGEQTGFSTLLKELVRDQGIGTGAPLLGANDKIDITGHSLGGHLALLFARMFPQYVDQVVTLNAPTFFSRGDNFLNSLGFTVRSNANITRLEADGDAVHLLGNVDPGYAIQIAQENAPGVFASVSTNHSSINGIDSLNLMAVLAKLDATYANNPLKLSDLIRSASNTPDDSYEKTLDPLRRIIQGGTLADTKVYSDAKSTNRASLYSNIEELTNSVAFKALAGKISITPQHSSSISVARNDFAALLSLVEGASFSLQSKDTAAQKLVMDKLQGGHDKDYADWLADANAIAKLQANPLAAANDWASPRGQRHLVF